MKYKKEFTAVAQNNQALNLLRSALIGFVIFFAVGCSEKPKYETYQVNGGKDTMVKLPSGMGINSGISTKTANELICNHRSGISPHEGKEIMDYIEHRENLISPR